MADETMSRRHFAQLSGLAVTGLLSLPSTAAPFGQGARQGQPSGRTAQAGSLTDVGDIRVGHFTDARRPTGCTAILFDQPVTAGVDYDGSAPGESLGVMLQPVSPVDRIHGMLLTGGGPMGLGATAGVVRFLEERHVGYDWGVPGVRVPIVVGAVIDDLSLGDGRIRPGPEEAYRACQAATGGPVSEGNVGVGAGATVGKMLRARQMPGMKGGVGSSSARFGDVAIAALAVANAAGDIVDRRTGQIVAGARSPDGQDFAHTVDVLRRGMAGDPLASIADDPFRSTTLSVVATNIALDKTSLTKLAMMANTGAARAINPYHTQGDGDQVFALSTGALKRDLSLTAIGAIAAELVADAIVRAVLTATSIPGWQAVRDVQER